MKRPLIGLIVLLLASAAAEVQAAGDEAAIQSVIQAYEDGYNTRSRTLLERAFDAKRAHVKSVTRVKDGADRVRVTPFEEWVVKVTGEGPDRDVTVKILSVTLIGDQIANVFLDFDTTLYDMMLLAKIDGAWKILNKVSIYQDPEGR